MGESSAEQEQIRTFHFQKKEELYLFNFRTGNSEQNSTIKGELVHFNLCKLNFGSHKMQTLVSDLQKKNPLLSSSEVATPRSLRGAAPLSLAS